MYVQYISINVVGCITGITVLYVYSSEAILQNGMVFILADINRVNMLYYALRHSNNNIYI